MLGRIHRAGESGYPKINKRFKPWDKNEFRKMANSILKIIDAKKKKTGFDLKAKKVLLFKKQCMNKEKIRYADFKNTQIGLIHGDYHSGNVCFDKKFPFERQKKPECVATPGLDYNSRNRRFVLFSTEAIYV